MPPNEKVSIVGPPWSEPLDLFAGETDATARRSSSAALAAHNPATVVPRTEFKVSCHEAGLRDVRMKLTSIRVA